MEKPDKVIISVFNLKGRLIHNETKFLSTGYHKIPNNCMKAQGIYILKLQRSEKALIKKVR